MRRASIRRDPVTRTWTARRPGYGFRHDDDETRTFPSQQAALRWVYRTLQPEGTPALVTERSEHIEDGISALPTWHPWWDPAGPTDQPTTSPGVIT